MALSKEEQIVALEEQIANTKGPGSAERKKVLNQQLKALKESKDGIENPDGDTRNADLDVTSWIPCTPEQVANAEQAGKLCGYDPIKCLMLVRK